MVEGKIHNRPQTGRWKEMAHGDSFSALTWSRDSQHLYFEDILGPSEPIYRVRPGETQAERVMDFATVLATGASRYQFVGRQPDWPRRSQLRVPRTSDGSLYLQPL